MSILQNKSTRALIIIMLALVIFGALIAKVYYSRINQSVDPRIKPARELYGQYNSLAQNNNYEGIFQLLDSVEAIYSKITHYQDSYETGVVWNNRAAAYLTLAVYKDSLPDLGGSDRLNGISHDSLLQLSEQASINSINIYENWQGRFQDIEEDEIAEMINPSFLSGLESYSEKKRKMILDQRIKEIEEAKWETQRRLSVAYTNLGLIYRHRNDFNTAAQYYKKALELWEDNLSAENNLNRLLGKPLRKRSIIQKLFPHERKKEM